MTAATMLKRINTLRKEIAKHEREIKRYEKEYIATGMEHMIREGERWIAYHRSIIEKKEEQIAEASKKAAELANDEEREAMVKAMAQEMAERGFKTKGFTTKGLRYIIEGNNGWTERSLHCWTMYIEGQGAVFTSGTLETVARYILNN